MPSKKSDATFSADAPGTLGFLRRNWIWFAVALAALLPMPWLIGPPCPDQITIAAGPKDGSYYAFAKQYQARLKPHGIDLKIETTQGSVSNLQRIGGEQPQVDLALVQGGTRHSGEDQHLRSLASLYHEPVWIFCNAELNVETLNDLRGKRISVGKTGSGTRQLAMSLLSLNGLEPGGETRLLDLGGSEAAESLVSGDLDAAIFVTSTNSGLVKSLLRSEKVKPLSLRRVNAYAARHQYLSIVSLPEGYMDLVANVPDHEVRLLAPTANLVATDALHPALVPLLLDVANRVHESGSSFSRFGQFPNLESVDFPVNDHARRYFRSGPSPLFRWLPFHWAALLDQIKLLLLPMCTLLLPLAKIAPPLYRRQIRCKIYRWYKVLREIDLELDTVGDSASVMANLERIDVLENELSDISVPLSYMEEFYNLRLHVEHVQKRLKECANPDASLKLRRGRAA